jgi:spore coat polysaccharide biosynthesis predicted glycosyltransferase SpsG
MLNRGRVLLVCDANPNMGTGHVMRQITLATALKSNGVTPLLFCNEIPDSLIHRAKSFEVEVQSRIHQQSESSLSSEIFSLKPDAVVFDGYSFSFETIRALFESGIPTIVLDDNGEFSDVECHLILNQNLHASEAQYENNSSSPQLLLGLNWSLIRHEIVRESNIHRSGNNGAVFVAMGGSDHLGLTALIVSELQSRDLTTSIAAGFYSASGMTPSEMATTMAESYALVIGCGTTVWEAMLLGKPFVGVVTAENQVEVGASLATAGICEIVDCRASIDVKAIGLAVSRLFESPAKSEFPSDRSLQHIDGLGSDRVAKAILDLIDKAVRT